METIRAYTTIEQSKKLAEILSIETADMRYDEYISHIDGTPKVGYKKGVTNGIPCWSLAALLSILPSATLDSSNDHYYRLRCMAKCTEWHDNAVDACYKMIIRLKVNK